MQSVKTLMSIFLGKWDPFSLNKQLTSFYRGSIHIEEKKFSLQKKRNPLYNSRMRLV